MSTEKKATKKAIDLKKEVEAKEVTTGADSFNDANKNDDFFAEAKETAQTGNDEWSKVSGDADVWDFEKNGDFVGFFKGTGKTLGTGAKATKTWKFEDMEGDEWLVPQWKALSALAEDTELGAKIYKIKHKGLKQMSNGQTFHKVDLMFKNAPEPRNFAYDNAE